MHLNNTQYQTIMRSYDLKRQHHRHLLEERRRKIEQAVPEYAKCQDLITMISAKRARAAAGGRSEAVADLKDEAEQLKCRMNTLLEENGFSPEDLEMTFDCPDCRDTGFIGSEKCHCFKQAVVDLLYQQSNIRELLKEENFRNFRLDYYSDVPDPGLGISPRANMRSVLKICNHFISHFDEEDDNLLFYGDTGVGKTFLTNCIAAALLDSCHTVIYLTAQHLVDLMQEKTFGHSEDSELDPDMFGYIFDCDLLIIDDLGTEFNNSFVTSQFFSCVNERLVRRKSTIISTNLSLDDLQNNYSERIFSRLVSKYRILKILGDDIRIKKAIS